MVKLIACNDKASVVSSFSSNIELLEGGANLSETNKKALFRAEFIRLVVIAGFDGQGDLALKLGVNPSTIRAISSGTRAPNADVLLDLHDTLGSDFIRLLKTSPAIEQLRKRRKKIEAEEIEDGEV